MADKYLDQNGLAYLWNKIEENAKPGPKGDSGVWLGTDEPSVDYNVWIDTDGSADEGLATKAEVDAKQDKLTAGTNITIDENNVISASGSGSGSSYELPVAGTHQLGGIKSGSSQAEKGNWIVTVDDEGYATVPFATVDNAGTMRPGYGLELNSSVPGMVKVRLPNVKNQLTGIVCPDGKTITMTSDGVISAVMPTVEGDVIQKALGVTSLSDQNFYNANKEWILDYRSRPAKYHVTVDGHPVIGIREVFNYLYLYYFAINNFPSTNFMEIKFVDNTFKQLAPYTEQSKYYSGDVQLITEQNYLNYTTGKWKVANGTQDSDLYNAKEVVIDWYDQSYQHRQNYLYVGVDGSGSVDNAIWGYGSMQGCEIILAQDRYGDSMSITYDGNNVNTNNVNINRIFYKT